MMFNLPENFKTNWKIIQQKIKSPHFFVAVSGGVDSMVLVNLLIQNQIIFTILHCNFQLREQESDGDEDFVIQFSLQNNIPYFVKKIKIKNDEEVVNGIQEKARTLRYQWFGEIMKNYENAFLLTAHHKNDVIETFLHNLFRGTGINGLSGIDEINFIQKIIRPFIHFYKEEIIHYALENNIIFREDSS
ncbi:MAG: tRNA lysidine(34) synthetase TilS, partial [Sediminibacterium sp.]|nr:tRNA lysidine(34) synthetase TilS [Sediminibacterium sp.]